MGYKKLVRFAEILTFPNVLQYPEGMPGKWKEETSTWGWDRRFGGGRIRR